MPFNLARVSSREMLELGQHVRALVAPTADAILDTVVKRLGPEVMVAALYEASAHGMAVLAHRGRLAAPATLEVDGARAGILSRVAIHPEMALPDVEAIFGALARDGRGESLAFLAILAGPLPPAVAREVELLGASIDVALRPSLGAYERLVQAQAVALQERDVALQAVSQLEDQLAQSRSSHAAELRRRQAAMLNVIEDLRDARQRLEERVAERTVELQSRNEELEQFAYIASHDLQEPLRTVAGYLQLIEQRYAARLDQDGLEFIAFAVEGAHRMQALIEALLLYSRVSRRDAAFEPVRLDDVVDDTLRSLAQAVRDADATIERSALPTVNGDRIQLGQLFQNLLSNALKFRGDQPAHVRVEASRDADGHHIFVRDRGIGFDNKHADRIFAVFRRLQRKYPGTGIGLAICKKIVERHRGSIQASAVVGGGATFEIVLPIGEG